MTTLGAVFLPQFAPERLRDVARAADEAGLEELWLWEDCFKNSGVAPMTAALAFTERLRVGIGLMPVPMRNVATTAMEAAALERLFPGRAIIGVGHGVLEWMGWIGARVASPLTLLGEYLDALRPLLAGERVTVDGRYVKLTDVALDWPPQQRVPVLAGAEGPKTLELVGAKADGVILTGGTTPDQVREALDPDRGGQRAAARTDRSVPGRRLHAGGHRPAAPRSGSRRSVAPGGSRTVPTSAPPATRRRSPPPSAPAGRTPASTRSCVQPTGDRARPRGVRPLPRPAGAPARRLSRLRVLRIGQPDARTVLAVPRSAASFGRGCPWTSAS